MFVIVIINEDVLYYFLLWSELHSLCISQCNLFVFALK